MIVVIGVNGGIAEVEWRPTGIVVIIKDHDSKEED
jgi:hypothetical protein